MTTTLDLSAANSATWTHGPIALLDEAGAPIEIDDTVAIAMQLRSSADSKSVALELFHANGRLIVVDALAATIRIEVPVADMRDVNDAMPRISLSPISRAV